MHAWSVRGLEGDIFNFLDVSAPGSFLFGLAEVDMLENVVGAQGPEYPGFFRFIGRETNCSETG